MIDPPEREKLKTLLGGLRVVKAEAGNGPHSGPYGKAEQAAYVVKCSCDPGPNGDGGQTVVIISGCFHSVRTCGGRTGCTSRFSVDQGISGHLTLRNFALDGVFQYPLAFEGFRAIREGYAVESRYPNEHWSNTGSPSWPGVPPARKRSSWEVFV